MYGVEGGREEWALWVGGWVGVCMYVYILDALCTLCRDGGESVPPYPWL